MPKTNIGGFAGEAYEGPICSTGSSTINGSYQNFSNTPTLTFIPLNSGTFKISFTAPFETIGGAFCSLKLVNSAGSATIVATNSNGFGALSGNAFGAVYLDLIVTLVAGISYSFDVQGTNSGGTGVQLRGDIGTGSSIIAQRMT